jgi:hypothetical protein
MTSNNMTSKAFNTLIDTYLDAWDMFGRDETLKALRRHYMDCCSHGDVVIRDLIKLLDEEKSPAEMAELDEDAAYFAEHITDNLEEWLENGRLKPDPWWAS